MTWCSLKSTGTTLPLHLSLPLPLRRGLYEGGGKAMSKTTLGPTQPPIQRVPGALNPGINRPGLEADHTPHLEPRLRLRGAILPLPYTSLWRGD